MPNHYTTFAICSPGHDFDCGEFNEKHGKTCLCSVVMPMPERLNGIVSSNPPVRYRHKATGAFWLEDCNGPMSDREQYDRVPLEAAEIATLEREVGAATWYEWASANWGTKWGTYNMKAAKVGGDSDPVVIAFQSAWGPPKILDKIAEWLKRVGKFEKVAFVGFDPANDSTQILPDEQSSAVPKTAQ